MPSIHFGLSFRTLITQPAHNVLFCYPNFPVNPPPPSRSHNYIGTYLLFVEHVVEHVWHISMCNDDKQLFQLFYLSSYITHCILYYTVFNFLYKIPKWSLTFCMPNHYICWWVFCNLCVCVYFCYVYKCSKKLFWSILY